MSHMMFGTIVPVRRLRWLGVVLVCAAAPLAAQATGRAPRLPRPAPAPLPAPASSPVPAPWPAPAPLPDLELARAGADMARSVAEAAASAAFDTDALRALSAARVVMQIDRGALQAMARASAPTLAAIAAEGQAMAPSLAPLAGGWDEHSARTRGFRTDALEPWDAQAPADSLYREGRKALSGDAYQRAVMLFRLIRERYPKSSYAPDAPYWEAFALQRLGGDANLRAAREALAAQQRDYPKAATRGDAASLSARIDGMLGRRDAAVGTTLVGRARRAADDGCSEDDERIDALNAVTQMDPEKAMPILKKVLARREPCTQQLRRTAVWLVASRKQPEAASLLMEVAKNDPDREVREQAVFWMANVPSDEATTMLVDLARRGDDLDLRKRAMYALSRSKSPKAAATLREIALDATESEDLRGDALTWYLASGALGTGDESLPFLKEVYGRAETADFKQRVLSVIASRRSDEARTFLLNVALNEREALDVRRTAVAMIGSRGTSLLVDGRQTATVQLATEQADAGVRALVTIYDRATDLDMRRTALLALAASRNDAGLDKLIDVARNERQTELRKAAIRSLSRSKDPRALAVLQEIIDK
ncbi:MAG: HEAT repeat domain-containing protein [Gemmatimonadaceae bacterium]